MLEQTCREIVEQTRYDTLKKNEINRIVTLFAHDIAMAAESGGQLAFDLIQEESDLIGQTGYTLWGRTEKCLSMDLAVQYNAMAVTASIREDFVAGTHPGAILFPILYAESEKRAYPVQELITTAAIGLKLAQLLNAHFGKYLSGRGYRPTTVAGSISAAGALAWLRYKSAVQALGAMAAAAATANGFAFPFQEGTEEWLLQVPLSAQAAIAACRNIRSTHFQHEQFLTGSYSLGSLLGYEADVAPSQADVTSIMNIGVKRHPVNSFVQPVVEALLRSDNVPTEEIQAVTVAVPESFARMQPALTGTGPYEKPNLSLFSIPISGAIALINRQLLFDDLKQANDPDVQSLAKKFSFEFSADLANYDVRIQIIAKGNSSVEYVDTSCFYPTLEEELQWIKEQHGGTLSWVEQFLKEWKLDS